MKYDFSDVEIKDEALKIMKRQKKQFEKKMLWDVEITNRVRGFEVVSDEHRSFPKHDIVLPTRSTNLSAGYDFKTPISFGMVPGQKFAFSTDIRVYMLDDEFLAVYIRSSIAIKKNIILDNLTGVIDCDYYKNVKNDGKIFIGLKNIGTENVYFERGDKICQGIFTKYFITDNDCMDNKHTRTGGHGSTGK